MSASPTEGGAPVDAGRSGLSPRTKLVESLFDNLSLWTVLAAAISFLYLVWATLDILGRYVGGFPQVAP